MRKRYPFKFLNSYNAKDKDIFFGRETEISQLYEMVYQTDLLLIYGFSGTGKSSLIQCGLATKFQAHQWMPIPVRRGNNLNQSLENALDASLKNSQADTEDLDWFEEKQEQGSPLVKKFKSIYLEHFKPIFLIFDQFEELYILGDKAEQRQFIETIREIMSLEQPIKVILSIREEYLGFLYDFEKDVPELLRKKIRVEAMNLDKVEQVIKGLATLENSLVSFPKEESSQEMFAELLFEKLKDENNLHIQLPYLQVFLDKMYHALSHDHKKESEAAFTLEALERTGNIGDVLADFLNEQCLDISHQLGISEEQLWDILSSFVTLEGTKEPLNIERIMQNNPAMPVELIQNILSQLVAKRILGIQEGSEMYEIAHDSLARQIAHKRTEEQISLLEVKRLIKTQAAEHQAREYFTEKQLAFIEPFLAKINLDAHEQSWIKQSREYVQRKKEEEENRKKAELLRTQKQLRNTRILLGAAFVALLLAIGASLFAWQANIYAEKALQKFTKEKSEKYSNAAKSFWVNQERELAKAAVDSALKINPDNKDAKELLEEMSR